MQVSAESGPLRPETCLIGSKCEVARRRLHPNLPALYRSKVEKLADALGEPATASEAAEILRSLIDRIVLTPTSEGLRAELYGDFVTIAAMAEGSAFTNKNPGSMAEPGLHVVGCGERI